MRAYAMIWQISIHALCEEGDRSKGSERMKQFISIHALCEEGDSATASSLSMSLDFYPRPLRGGRR